MLDLFGSPSSPPRARVIHGDCLVEMAKLDAESVDAVVTDPPAGISFMGREWDSDKGGRTQWVAWMESVAREALRVVKPGGHTLVWALPRTSHWTGWAWESAGWVPRDVVHHVFGTGFPKSLDVSKAIDKAVGVEFVSKPASGVGFMGPDGPGGYNVTKNQLERVGNSTDAARQWSGWGTALKPAVENWWLFRKSLSEPNVAANVLRFGTGAINVDACRVDFVGPGDEAESKTKNQHGDFGSGPMTNEVYGKFTKDRDNYNPTGRWPANLVHDGSDEVKACFPESTSVGHAPKRGKGNPFGGVNDTEREELRFKDKGSTARFFKACEFSDDERRLLYAPKASRAERAGSKHPTVKPLTLMRYLCRLICPPDGRVLDPFAGSGTTLAAALAEGFRCVGIEQDATYVEDIRRRIGEYL